MQEVSDFLVTFFFQAEDGIRDIGVTGVQTCALPISFSFGVEIVRDQRTKEKAPELRNKIVQLAFQKGLLILGAGDTSVRLSPPLLIDEEHADFAVRTLEECFREVGKN